VVLSGSATAQPAIPIPDVNVLVGKWVGTATSPRFNSPYELTVNENGTWNSVVPNIPPGKFTGTVQASKGKATLHSDTTKITYDVTLYEREGKQALQLTSGLPTGGRVVIDLTRAQ
jgi:hypothetical protein